jgi:hypothetical protein
MNQEIILAVLPDRAEKAMSMREIAEAMGLDLSSYIYWIRVERRLAHSLRALIKWGWVACEHRQRTDGHKFWYNAYWKTELARQEEGSLAILDGVMVPTEQE